MNRKVLTISIISVLAVVILGVFFTLEKKEVTTPVEEVGQEVVNEEEIVVEDLKTEEEKEVEIIDVPEIDTSTWKTYRNEEFGFEFRYPGEDSGWIFRKFEDDKSLSLWSFALSHVDGHGWDVNIRIFPKTINGLLSDVEYDIQKHWGIEKKEFVRISSLVEGERVYWNNNSSLIYIQKNDYPLTIEFNDYKNSSIKQYQDVMSKVILSLKFIEK